MFLTEQQTYYDLLEISPQANSSEIKSAYLRMKSAYGKDSAATYSLVSTEDIEFLLKRLDEAFEILTSIEKRKEYDIASGIIPKESNIVSIDRVPPMDLSDASDDLLVAPSTDFSPQQHFQSQDFQAPSFLTQAPTIAVIITPAKVPEKHIYSILDIANFQLELDRETEWSGSFLRRTRETLGISIDELATFSRVNKSYLVAIEDDIYKKLPAPVFLRGFLMQICKKLRLPHDKVISAYLDRYKNICPEKF